MNHLSKSQSFRGATRALSAAALFVALTGCATAPAVKPLAEAETVTVELSGPRASVGQVPVGSKVGLATAAGAGGGALYGAAAGFSCGPFFVICSPIGAIAGAIGGAIVVGTEEAVTTLPDGQAETFNVVLHDVFKSFDPRDSLKLAAEEAVRARDKFVLASGGQATLSIGLARVDWVIGTGNTVRPRVNVTVTATAQNGIASRSYQRDGTRLGVAQWTAESGVPIKRELEKLFADLAVEIAAHFDAELERADG